MSRLSSQTIPIHKEVRPWTRSDYVFYGVIALLAGGLWSAAVARGMETVFRGSLFRTGYEIFYMPMPLHEKRAAKGVIDVAFDFEGLVDE